MSKEVLVLFVWSREVEWSSRVAEQCLEITSPTLVLRSISADSIEIRTILANSTPHIDYVPAIISIAKTKGLVEKEVVVIYGEEEIETLLVTLGVLNREYNSERDIR